MKTPDVWTAVLATLWSVIFGFSVFQTYLPASYWVEASDLRVSDSVSGECPMFDLDRVIHRNFQGYWSATLQRYYSGPAPGFGNFRTYGGTNDYRPDTVLPGDVERNLYWLLRMYETNHTCNWPPGRYRLLFLWTFEEGRGGPRHVRVTSNPFTIHQAPEDF